MLQKCLCSHLRGLFLQLSASLPSHRYCVSRGMTDEWVGVPCGLKVKKLKDVEEKMIVDHWAALVLIPP